MLRLRTRLDIVPLFAALGWLAACGPAKNETETETGSASASASASGSTAGTGSTAATTGTATAAVTTGNPAECAGAVTELMQSHIDPPEPSGYVRCDDGIVHRPAKLECLAPATPSNCPIDASAGGCFTNDDCTDKPFGSCQILVSLGGISATTGATTGGGGPSCTCLYGCQTDADCAAGEICRCAGDGLGPATICIPAGCTEDADCPGEICGVSGDVCAEGLIEAGCTTPMDECDQDSDCGFDPCIFETGKWICNNSVCGRPFIVDAAPVTAPAAARDDWRALLTAPSAPPALHPRLCAHFTAIALGEHASVASFAGFILQLLSLGAPPALVRDAHQALADEIEHARIGFALASLYGGTGVGPGPLPLAGPIAGGDVDTIVAAVIAEACVAETLAGLELQEAAAIAEDPALARVLATIAADEQRHAELGWRFVQWALAHAGADRSRAEAAFAAALAGAEHALQDMSQEPGDPELRPHGVVDAPLRAAVWRRGLAELVRPAASRLCAA